MKTITVTDANDVRLDRYLRRIFVNSTQGVIEKSLRNKAILLNGKRAEAKIRISNGDIISYYSKLFGIKEDSEIDIESFNKNIVALANKIQNEYLIYSCDQFMAINKPCGLAVQGGTKVSLSIDDALGYLNSKDSKSYKLVHRLDKDTSGVLLIANGYENAATITKAFKDKLIEKHYLAWVKGVFKMPAGRVENYIGKERSGAFEIVKITDDSIGKVAITNYKTIKFVDGQSLIEFTPETGRTHQLRVHSQYLGCPIVGDVKYGGNLNDRMMLHAHSVIIPKDLFGKRIEIIAPIDWI